MNLDARSAYRQSTGQSASPLRLVVLLYEQLVEDVRRALGAMDQGDAAGVAFNIGHALEVVGQLQGRLDMNHGGEVAENLERFYNLLRYNLLQAQMRSSKNILQRQLENLLTLREAWLEVERAETAAANPGPPAAPGNDKPLNWSA
jgi:flagellar secretion chaperone FliS